MIIIACLAGTTSVICRSRDCIGNHRCRGANSASPELRDHAESFLGFARLVDFSYEDNYLIERRVGTNETWTLLSVVTRDILLHRQIRCPSYGLRIPALRHQSRRSLGLFKHEKRRHTANPNSCCANLFHGKSPFRVHQFPLKLTGRSWRKRLPTRQRRSEDPNSWSTISVMDSNVLTCVVSNLSQTAQVLLPAGFQSRNVALVFGSSVMPYNIVRLIEDDFNRERRFLGLEQNHAVLRQTANIGFRGDNVLWFSSIGYARGYDNSGSIHRMAAPFSFMRAGNEAVDGSPLWNNSENGETVLLEYTKNHVNSIWSHPPGSKYRLSCCSVTGH